MSEEVKQTKERKPLTKLIINLICGIAIGAGAILPGISGGVLCVVFGVYQPIMELFSHPVSGIKSHWRMFIPIVVGWAIGFFAFSNLIKIMFGASELYATWLFIGLIAGEIPSLFKEAGKKGRNKNSYISMIIGFVVMFAVLLAISLLPNVEVKINFFAYLFAGVLWGLSIIIPGMTSSSILMCLGIYESFNEGLSVLKFSVIGPWVLGMGVTVLLFARLVNKAFAKHYSVCYHAVIGIVIASTLIIVPVFADYNWVRILISLACLAGGFVAAYLSESIKAE